jgi:DNA-binding response OmpR family regulator
MMHRVLIVDDDQLVADTLSLIFNKCGYDATAAYSADQAMEFARVSPPNLLLCDISMPGRDGVELVKEMSGEFPACRILVLTGFHSNLKRVSEQSNTLPRPLGIMTKPCQPDDLLREANALLASA